VLLEKSTEVSGVVLAYALSKHYLAQHSTEQLVASLSPIVLNVKQEKITEVDCMQFSVSHVGNASVNIMWLNYCVN